jgi:UDP-N-acetyl-2-amino-2-deoxyglucuronate dehydrogenase
VLRSGGIATNIGIHFFDMLIWVFGGVKNVEVEKLQSDSAAGYLELERARVKWNLSINYNDIPDGVKATGKKTYRSLTMEGEEIEFSDGFTDLHTMSYQNIVSGNGFGLTDTRAAIELAYQIRNSNK